MAAIRILRLIRLTSFLFLAVTFMAVHACPAPGQERCVVFSTWEGFEVDKCASIWLIRTRINPGAEIRWFPRGTTDLPGCGFDTPFATFRRTVNASTFEALLRCFNLTDCRLVRLGRIIHDIEINTWEKKVMAETPSVATTVNGVILSDADPGEVILKTCRYFDDFYNKMAPCEQ